MKLFSLLALLLAVPAVADEYPVLKAYEAQARELVTITTAARTQADVPALLEKTRTLVTTGAELMVLYAEKNPRCAEQFEEMLSEVPQIEFMALDEANRRYHDGRGLPSAPRHCYFGRSQVIHAALNVIRLKAPWTDAVREATLKDLEEVIEHVAAVQRNLDNPPN
jgi:hypothetical protein